jgi:hypothetical protein
MTSKFLVQGDRRSCTADNLCPLVRGSVNGGRSVMRYPSTRLKDLLLPPLYRYEGRLQCGLPKNGRPEAEDVIWSLITSWMNTESPSVYEEMRTFTRSSTSKLRFSLFLAVVNPCLSSVLRIHWWGADQFDGPSGTPSSGSTHEIDVFSIFIADFRLRNSLGRRKTSSVHFSHS